MKVKSIIFLLILIILFTSCSKKKANLITTYKYKIFTSEDKEVSDTVFFVKKIETGKNENYELYLNQSDSNSIVYVIKQFVNFEKKIIFINDTCQFISSKLYFVKDKKIKVFKYKLNRKNSFDEESNIYYNSEIGLIAVYNYRWSVLSYLEYEKTIGLRKLFIYDTSGFVLSKKINYQYDL